jgi:hypothetical protein
MEGEKMNNKISVNHFPIVWVVAYVVCIALSFVDMTFLQNTIATILQTSPTMSTLVAFGLGLAGIVIMSLRGHSLASEGNKKAVRGEWWLWLVFGIAIAIMRLISYKLGVDSESGLVDIFGFDFSGSDLLVAPLMFVIYLMTGTLACSAVRHFTDPTYWDWWQDKKEFKRKKQELQNKHNELQHLFGEAELFIPRVERVKETVKRDEDLIKVYCDSAQSKISRAIVEKTGVPVDIVQQIEDQYRMKMK